ncbi:cell surface A33 antigen-like [Colossoma macropomum]|uniref:cell surface A33 antigen-like n=1 Tax=Colossoma macropomum TaxID=42526 RepID=UPI001865141A|nr:cell surface A33 antigen-like [Colossoma macropomum]
MQVCLYLLLVLHVAEGCTLKDHEEVEKITAYSGGSVLLPCYCTDLQDTPKTFTWKNLTTNIAILKEMSSESGQYRNRVQLANGHSPGNLSLLISHLTEEDGGDYRCEVEGSRNKNIRLSIKGCTLTNNTERLDITAATGGSVLLPCSCAELRAKPKTLTWKKYNQNSKKWDSMPIESGQSRNRVQLVDDDYPGNLSLLISHLTEEDGGDYMCDAMKSGLTYIRLTVKGTSPLNDAAGIAEPPHPLPFVPFALVTVIFLHIIVAVVYHTKRNKDVSSPSTIELELIISSTVGGLLLLMVLIRVIYWRYRAQRQGQMEGCDRKTEWGRDQETQNDSEVLFATVNEDKCNKGQEMDNCEVLYAAVDKKDKCKTFEENDDVTYSTVVYFERSTSATVLLDTEETTEYTSIKLN